MSAEKIKIRDFTRIFCDVEEEILGKVFLSD